MGKMDNEGHSDVIPLQVLLSKYGCKALLDPDRFFSFLILRSRQDSLDGGSARRKAAIDSVT
jgi:hypothetical protein